AILHKILIPGVIGRLDASLVAEEHRIEQHRSEHDAAPLLGLAFDEEVSEIAFAELGADGKIAKGAGTARQSVGDIDPSNAEKISGRQIEKRGGKLSLEELTEPRAERRSTELAQQTVAVDAGAMVAQDAHDGNQKGL